MHADLLLRGGSAYSSGWGRPRSWGVAVAGDRIVAVGPEAALDSWRGPGTRVVDLNGSLVLPAFHDAHAHPLMGGLELLACNLTQAQDARQCLDQVGAYAAAHPDVGWITGGGWTMFFFPGGTPTAGALDDVVADRPVVLHNRDHHGVWVNSEALRRAGITRDTIDPTGGRIERDADGNPSGTLHEAAMALVTDLMPAVDDERALRGLLRGQAEFHSWGIAGWQDAYVGSTGGVGDVLAIYERAVAEGLLRSRVTAALWWDREAGMAQLAGHVARRDRIDALGLPQWLTADAIKIMVDGVAENFTAALSRPYADAHGCVTDNLGLTFLTPEHLDEAVAGLHAAGLSAHFHALGDRAVTLSLDAIEKAYQRHGRRVGARHQLAHLQVVAAADVERFARLDVIANLQMLWASVDEALDELTFPFIDPALIERHYPFGDLLRAGVSLAAGSDWPVSSAKPFEAIAVGISRAKPGEPRDPRMREDQMLPLAVALDAYTAGAAAAGGRGAWAGRLEAGMAADFVVVEADPFTLSTPEIAELGVAQTWVAGECVFGDAT